MSDFVAGLVADFHKFVEADKEKAERALSEIKKIFGFDEATAKAYVEAHAPALEQEVKADATQVVKDAETAVKAAEPVVAQAAETAVKNVASEVK